jgi:hypothetical protein
VPLLLVSYWHQFNSRYYLAGFPLFPIVKVTRIPGW